MAAGSALVLTVASAALRWSSHVRQQPQQHRLCTLTARQGAQHPPEYPRQQRLTSPQRLLPASCRRWGSSTGLVAPVPPQQPPLALRPRWLRMPHMHSLALLLGLPATCLSAQRFMLLRQPTQRPAVATPALGQHCSSSSPLQVAVPPAARQPHLLPMAAGLHLRGGVEAHARHLAVRQLRAARRPVVVGRSEIRLHLLASCRWRRLLPRRWRAQASSQSCRRTFAASRTLSLHQLLQRPQPQRHHRLAMPRWLPHLQVLTAALQLLELAPLRRPCRPAPKQRQQTCKRSQDCLVLHSRRLATRTRPLVCTAVLHLQLLRLG